MALFLFLVIVAMALGIIGTVVHGLGYLLVIGVVLFVADVIFSLLSWSRRTRRRRLR
ncbi:hypothetical protein HUT19_22015 [Streptomyces sp. NA02950]|uniref:hypothetical protein n=1 Tax=Streptomyces sp. NA02950 TaxID=2742137 RepID=UPI001592077A|nr:hypothetical protein [Streptomyces sp. NA02950]QKV94104.1 hypothetical protein HUT19_22015 [Streptomyces sp. NA02950]